MLEILTRIFKPEIHVTSVEELRSGPVIVHGVVRQPDPYILTPFRSTRCVAYDYLATCVVKTRQGFMPQQLRKATVITTFDFDLEGGSVRAVPTRSDPPVTADEHRALQSSGREGFVVREDTILPGRRAMLRGMARRVGDGWEVHFHEMVPGEETTAEPVARRRRSK